LLILKEKDRDFQPCVVSLEALVPGDNFYRLVEVKLDLNFVRDLADLYEVIDALLVAFDLDKQAVLAMQQKRRDERGGFERRIKLL
jgi:hypothetical protein